LLFRASCDEYFGLKTRDQAIAWCPWQDSLLATGGGTNDRKIHIWDISVKDSNPSERAEVGVSIHSILLWVLMRDRADIQKKVKTESLYSLSTGSQVTSVQWAPHEKALFSTHGYPTNSVMVHGYPSLEPVAEIKNAHAHRVLFSAVAPAGDVVCTGSGDGQLKFWKVWEQPEK
jgi:cell division cycle protein 20 (cofactor of APC complex)